MLRGKRFYIGSKKSVTKAFRRQLWLGLPNLSPSPIRMSDVNGTVMWILSCFPMIRSESCSHVRD
jgi:hypothetical protein